MIMPPDSEPTPVPLMSSPSTGSDGRRRRHIARLVAAVAGVLVVAAVGALAVTALGGGRGSTANAPGGAAAAGEGAGSEERVVGPPILDVADEGGFIGPAADFGRLPTFYVSGDGRLITPGPQVLVYPGPALANLRQRQLTHAGRVALRGLAEAAGLAHRPPEYGRPPVADAPTTIFVYRDADGRTFVHRVEALDFDARLTPSQVDARRGLRHLLEQLADPEGSLGAGEVGADTAYAAEAFRIRAEPVEPVSGDGASSAPSSGPSTTATPALPWPVASVSLAQPASCTPVTGPDATVLRDALATANQLTSWTQDGVVYQVAIREVLPGEPACP
jgi:hypothetical protein